MSRSYNKHPCYHVNSHYPHRKIIKRIRNKMVHYAKEVKNGNYYKKLHSSWNEYKFSETLIDVINVYIKDGKCPEEAYAYWIKTYYFK